MVGLEDLHSNVMVENGRFFVELNQWTGDFDGNEYWLEIAAAIPAGSGNFTTLTPRQRITPVPYSEYAYDMDVTGLQFRVNDSCVGNSAISVINQDGSVSCASFVTSDQACSVGQVVTGVAQDGTLTCATDEVGLTVVTGNEIIDGSVEDIDLASGIAANKVAGTAAVRSFTGTQSFDTELLTMNANSNRVGINTTSPQHELDVEGTVRSSGDVLTDGEYVYSSPKSYSHHTRPLEFRAANTTTVDDYGLFDESGAFGFTKIVGTTYLVAPVHLPDQATITDVTCYWMDSTSFSDFNSLSFELHRAGIGFFGSSPIASASESVVNLIGHNSFDVDSFTDSTISNAVVDNTNYVYFYRFRMNSNSNPPCTTSCLLRFYGCQTHYTVSTVVP